MNEGVAAALRKETDAEDDRYVRMLELEIVNLRLKLAHTKSQLEEHRFLSSKRQNALQGFHDNLKGKNYILNLENSRFQSELLASNKKSKFNENRCREQVLVIAQLQKNATASRGKQRLTSNVNFRNVKQEKDSCKYENTHSLQRIFYKCSAKFTNEEINDSL